MCIDGMCIDGVQSHCHTDTATHRPPTATRSPCRVGDTLPQPGFVSPAHAGPAALARSHPAAPDRARAAGAAAHAVLHTRSWSARSWLVRILSARCSVVPELLGEVRLRVRRGQTAKAAAAPLLERESADGSRSPRPTMYFNCISTASQVHLNCISSASRPGKT